MVASGTPLSAAFWHSAEQVLAEISGGRATVGEVRRWLEATGTEPMALVGGGFVWPEEGERGPVADEMHARLVGHLERLVSEGTVDPDRLAAGDAAAWTAHERLQVDWLRTPLPDGREPMWAVSDEEDEGFLAEWDEADAEARAIMTELLVDAPPRPLPATELQMACRRLRAGLRTGDWPYDLIRAAGGVARADLPPDDVDLWLTLGAGVVSCRNEPPARLDAEAQAAWMALTHPDWIGAVVTLVRGGIGTPAEAASLAEYAAGFDFEAGPDDDPFDDEDIDEAVPVLTAGFGPVEVMWSTLGAIDDDGRLTALGWWGLPQTLARAWSSEPAGG